MHVVSLRHFECSCRFVRLAGLLLEAGKELPAVRAIPFRNERAFKVRNRAISRADLV
jgi:hypothetical protein